MVNYCRTIFKSPDHTHIAIMTSSAKPVRAYILVNFGETAVTKYTFDTHHMASIHIDHSGARRHLPTSGTGSQTYSRLSAPKSEYNIFCVQGATSTRTSTTQKT
ncbi:hypothetical protein AVEN_212909-1 [Araneus ventricosus]|uniref:Uncharacterized protein n=1 Tax=Araneus ventricosus TaxID=182803 RepID=A0A4Y2R5Y9_ARAVE|nr:hypothetical protein AVEN_212909-1 [Araneus ventricosus]